MTTATALPALRSFAAAEYQRVKERAVMAFGQGTLPRATAERLSRSWLSALLRIGGDHPDAAPWIAQEREAAPHWPETAHRLCAAEVLASLPDVIRAVDHRRDGAFAALLGHEDPATGTCDPQGRTHFDQLRALSRALGSTTPCPASPVGSQPGDRRHGGTGHPIPQEKAA